MTNRIHILGASGAGTTTLGRALAEELKCPHYDVDYFFWLPTDPPFTKSREENERVSLLMKSLRGNEQWTLSGCLCEWGQAVIPLFSLVIFILIPSDARIQRLRAREQRDFGDRLKPGGNMHQDHKDFIKWALQYDDGGIEVRSRKMHEEWLKTLPCPVVRLEGVMSTSAQVETVMGGL